MDEITETRHDHHAPKRKRSLAKVLAISSAAAIAAVGVTGTLAAWTDTEWIHGGVTGSPAGTVGTSTFEVQQSTDAAFATWSSQEANPGGAILFTANASALTPGDTTYATLALRTTATSVGGDVTLAAAVAASPLPTGVTVSDTGSLLFDALQLEVATSATTFATCDAATFTAPPTGATVIANGPLSSISGNAAQTLAAAAGSTQYYCFAISLPDAVTLAGIHSPVSDYMGRSVVPAWKFDAISN